MEHSNCKLKNGERIGENIYFCWSSDPTAGVKGNGNKAYGVLLNILCASFPFGFEGGKLKLILLYACQ